MLQPWEHVREHQALYHPSRHRSCAASLLPSAFPSHRSLPRGKRLKSVGVPSPAPQHNGFLFPSSQRPTEELQILFAYSVPLSPNWISPRPCCLLKRMVEIPRSRSKTGPTVGGLAVLRRADVQVVREASLAHR